MRPNSSVSTLALSLIVLCHASPADQTSVRVPSGLTCVPRSTRKLEQLIGDHDKHLDRPTGNRTWSRFRVRGTDLGSSFEHGGELIFLFGDTIGPGGGDCIAHSSSTDPDQGLALDFYRAADGDYLKIQPPGVRMAGFEVPTGGVSVEGKAYLFCTTDHSSQHVMGRSVLVRFAPESQQFVTVRDVSRRPGNFINIAPRIAPPVTEHLPGEPGSQQLLLWGSGQYRRSHAYLASIEAARLEEENATHYWCGFDDQQRPRWTQDEAAAKPLVQHPVIGELSVAWCRDAGIWLLTYNSSQPRGIVLRWARQPWGPWSEPIVIFDPWRDGGYGQFMRAAVPGGGRGPWGPVIAPGQDPQKVWGGEYGPYLIERFTQVADSRLTLYYLMSTWNPYTVVLMKSQLQLQY